MATKRGNVPTQSWSDKSAVFLMVGALTSHGSSKSNKKTSNGRGISDFLFIHNHLTLRKWCYTRLQHDFALDPIISPFDFHFQTFVMWLREIYDYRNVSWEMICIYDLTLSKMRGGVNVTHALSNTFYIISFCSDLSCRWNCLSCRIRFISSSMWFVCCCLHMQIIWHAALSSSHHSVCIARLRL
jgi:hypothetical protein